MTWADFESLDEAVDHVRGGAAGTVILEYGDYECPYSRHAFREIEHVERRPAGDLLFNAEFPTGVNTYRAYVLAWSGSGSGGSGGPGHGGQAGSGHGHSGHRARHSHGQLSGYGGDPRSSSGSRDGGHRS